MITLAKISSVYCQQHYNINKNYLRFALINVFNLTDSKELKKCKVPVSELLPYYNLVKKLSTKTLEEASKGYIERYGKSFLVVYHGATRASIRTSTVHCLLSFREAAPEYELPAYVLIKPYCEGDT